MNKHESEVSTLLQNLLQYIALRFEWQCLKRHTGKAGLWAYGVDAWTVGSGQTDAWTMDDWTLGLWTTRHLDSGLLNSEQLYAWTLDS